MTHGALNSASGVDSSKSVGLQTTPDRLFDISLNLSDWLQTGKLGDSTRLDRCYELVDFLRRSKYCK
uniref:Uncharacterized protein n=2 Tax=Timema TaxID=61471 RepID=A0A7R9IPL6_9NEOP|nr:unnamed protein product [Timema bartmani]CAD7462285.1 unnamed protein product [Timema tahoe]